MAEPLPAGSTGIADWQDYVNNWREADAEWLQARSILRFTNAAERDTKVPAPGLGQVVFNAEIGALEMRGASAWAPYKPLPQFLTKTVDDNTQVALSHVGAAGKGVVFTPAGVNTSGPFTVLGGILTADATGVTIKTGAVSAKLTTDAANLVIDKPITVPNINVTGSGVVFDATGKQINVGTLQANQVTAASISLSGVLTGGASSSASIGGVKLGQIANVVEATGLIAGTGGYFYGGATSAIMRQRNPSTGAVGGAYVQVLEDRINIAGPEYTVVYNSLYIDNSAAPLRQHPWATQGATGYLAPVIYSASDPGAANYPNGTIWIS